MSGGALENWVTLVVVAFEVVGLLRAYAASRKSRARRASGSERPAQLRSSRRGDGGRRHHDIFGATTWSPLASVGNCVKQLRIILTGNL